MKAGCCLTSLSEAIIENIESARKHSHGALKHLKAGYCLTSLLKPIENFGEGARKHLKAGYCLTSLSEAIRKHI